MNQKNIPKPANTDKRDFLVQIFDGTWQLQQLTCNTPQTTTCIAVPEGATHAVMQHHSKAYPLCLIRYLGGDLYQQFNNFNNEWFEVFGGFNTFISARELVWQRKPKLAIEMGSDYAVGSIVVFVDETKSDCLMTVFKVQGDSVLLDGNRNFALNHLVRLATEMERQAQKRLPSNAHILQDIEKREFELGLAPDDAYVKSGSDEQLHLDRALKAQGEVA